MNWEPYLPSNGSEGSLFEAAFCDRCKKDEHQDCAIHTNALAGIQPVEWRRPVEDAEYPGKAECTAFDGDSRE